MSYEVVVVGGGIGGLTTAALLAARGVSVCVIEKESSAGGCVSAFEKFEYKFEPGMGLYSSWQPGEIHQRVFAELPLAPPETRKLSPAYVVRLPDQSEVAIVEDREELEDSLRAHFPECVEVAIDFYRAIESATSTSHGALSLATHLTKTSPRFRRFIDSQLQIFAQGDSESCSFADSAEALMAPLRGAFAIQGGAAALANRLVDSIRASGGTVRMNTTALRLSFDSSGQANGLDLMTGETVQATRAIVSNLTIWDTYGKLLGMSKTPIEIRSRLKHLSGWGAYLMFLGMDEVTSKRLPADHILCVSEEEQAYDPESAQFMFAAAPDWDRRAPNGKRAVTISIATEASQWFSFHEDETELEAQDQAAMESLWERLHAALPELGSGIEVIETMTPRDFYHNTRRKLGMVYGISRTRDSLNSVPISHRTIFPNLFMVGDTVYPGQGVAAVTRSGLIVANEIAPSTKS